MRCQTFCSLFSWIRSYSLIWLQKTSPKEKNKTLWEVWKKWLGLGHLSIPSEKNPLNWQILNSLFSSAYETHECDFVNSLDKPQFRINHVWMKRDPLVCHFLRRARRKSRRKHLETLHGCMVIWAKSNPRQNAWGFLFEPPLWQFLLILVAGFFISDNRIPCWLLRFQDEVYLQEPSRFQRTPAKSELSFLWTAHVATPLFSTQT